MPMPPLAGSVSPELSARVPTLTEVLEVPTLTEALALPDLGDEQVRAHVDEPGAVPPTQEAQRVEMIMGALGPQLQALVSSRLRDALAPALQDALQQAVTEAMEVAVDRVVEQFRGPMIQALEAHLREVLEAEIGQWPPQALPQDRVSAKISGAMTGAGAARFP